MKKELELSDFKKFILEANKLIQKNREYLCVLDSHVGDGDHGTTIARGFRAVIEAIDKEPVDTITEFLKLVGNTLTDAMGGASGPIFGSLFKGMALAAKDKESVTASDLIAMYEMGAGRIMKLGNAKPGDKTLLDSLLPAIESQKNSNRKEGDLVVVHREMLEAASRGVEATKEMVASKGRSRYAGERGIGHQDAGATSICLILEAAYNAVST